MLLDRKTLLKIWLNPGLTIFGETCHWARGWIYSNRLRIAHALKLMSHKIVVLIIAIIIIVLI